jgi:hypothetical protein
MRSCRAACFLFAGLLALQSPRAAGAQEQYQGLPLAPYEIYQAVVGYAADQNFDALGKSLKHFPGLIQALSDHCGKDLQSELEQALLKRDALATRQALMEMIFADFSLNLSQAVARPDRSSRRERLEMAYVDLTFLARDASAIAPGIVDETRSGLTRLAKLQDRGEVETAAKAIRHRLSQAVPHCDLPLSTP